ncbi:toxin-antitoxin system YwqK family antitoxin [Pedobacter cryoconitis]|uniref:toxin-antitoxin system YwqK family antitoxin n=1 Tax=Pedobacter cryoconitis TaxID=188932 RepID=UPI001611C3C9|nr:hypothetical protein [Pedobacter cryoconitis]MBB5646541.1 hypothetical protein [Pedobacter cryoconitis]
MKSLNKNLLFFIGIAAIFYFNREKIQMKCVELFKQDATFINHNSEGKANGKVTIYKAGKVYVIGHVLNGIKQGWEIMYYENGKIKSKTFFVDGQPSGKGYLYNNNGKLAYSGYYMDGKPYGGWYNYYDNGHKKKYLLYDINKKISFSIDYDIEGNLKLKEMNGLVVSPDFYSINSKNKAVTPLGYQLSASRVFTDVNDLYITVANPEKARLSITVKINQSQYKFLKVVNSTVKISNAFPEKGKYRILIESNLYDINNKIINGVNLIDSVIKQ